MRILGSLAMLLMLGAIVSAGPATRPTLSLTDKQIVAGYDVALKAGKTREGVPRRIGIIKAEDNSRIQLGIIGEEGHPIAVILPEVMLVPNAYEGNGGTLKVMQTIFLNVVGHKYEKAVFTKMVRDLMDARARGDSEVTRDIGDVHVVLELSPQANESFIDVTLTMTRKPE